MVRPHPRLRRQRLVRSAAQPRPQFCQLEPSIDAPFRQNPRGSIPSLLPPPLDASHAPSRDTDKKRAAGGHDSEDSVITCSSLQVGDAPWRKTCTPNILPAYPGASPYLPSCQAREASRHKLPCHPVTQPDISSRSSLDSCGVFRIDRAMFTFPVIQDLQVIHGHFLNNQPRLAYVNIGSGGINAEQPARYPDLLPEVASRRVVPVPAGMGDRRDTDHPTRMADLHGVGRIRIFVVGGYDPPEERSIIRIRQRTAPSRRPPGEKSASNISHDLPCHFHMVDVSLSSSNPMLIRSV